MKQTRKATPVLKSKPKQNKSNNGTKYIIVLLLLMVFLLVALLQQRDLLDAPIIPCALKNDQ